MYPVSPQAAVELRLSAHLLPLPGRHRGHRGHGGRGGGGGGGGAGGEAAGGVRAVRQQLLHQARGVPGVDTE